MDVFEKAKGKAALVKAVLEMCSEDGLLKLPLTHQDNRCGYMLKQKASDGTDVVIQCFTAYDRHHGPVGFEVNVFRESPSEKEVPSIRLIFKTEGDVRFFSNHVLYQPEEFHFRQNFSLHAGKFNGKVLYDFHPNFRLYGSARFYGVDRSFVELDFSGEQNKVFITEDEEYIFSEKRRRLGFQDEKRFSEKEVFGE